MRHFTEEELIFVKQQLKLKIPYTQFLRSRLHVDSRDFKRMCKENGIDYPQFRKRFVHDNPFKDINNPNVQYWLGWLATDGYISHKDSRITLDLALRDIDVLEKFRDFISPKLKIRHVIHHKKYPMVMISFRNKEISDFLYELGFKENKTFTFCPNFNISWDYIRGVFEGDGYFRWGDTNEISISSACLEHVTVIQNFTNLYNINSKIYIKKSQKGTTMYYYTINAKNSIISFINYIYNNAQTFMNRKFDKARIISNDDWKTLKFGELALGIPSQASQEEGVTT